MVNDSTHGRMVHATLCEVEHGLFFISYRTGDMQHDTHRLPPYEVGTCVSDVRQRIEQQARGCGYEVIVWDSPASDTGPLTGNQTH